MIKEHNFDEIIRGGLSMYVETIGTDKCIETIELVCRTLMTAKEMDAIKDMKLTAQDVVVLQHMRYSNSLNPIYQTLIDSIIIDVMIDYKNAVRNMVYIHISESNDKFDVRSITPAYMDELTKIRREKYRSVPGNKYEEV